MKCVHCKSKLEQGVKKRSIVISGEGVVSIITCHNCGRAHKKDGTGIDKDSGQRVFFSSEQNAFVLKPPKQ